MSEESPASAPQGAPDISIRAKPPSPKRLSRKVLLGGALVMASIIAFALLYGLSGRQRAQQAGEAQSSTAAGPPDTIRMAPQNYAPADVGGGNAEIAETPAAAEQLAPPQDPMWSGRRGAGGWTPNATRAPDPDAIARTAPIMFSQARARPSAANTASAHAGGHADFLDTDRNSDDRLQARLSPPRSRYELLAGAVIPAALQTELNSDLPGRIVAQVTAPVFDSVSGRILLIPQGARLIGAYDSAATYGDRRLLLVWNRLILPNGWSIDLEGMEGSDASGAAGLRDRTDNHLGRLTGAIGLSAIMSVIANRSEDDNRASLTQSVGDAAAQQAAQTGARIVDRELSVHPTLRVRAGAPVRVLVTRDIVLRPYRE